MSQDLSRGEEMEMLKNVNPNNFGYGTPSANTRALMSADLIDVVMHDDGIHWHAVLTERGQKRLSAS